MRTHLRIFVALALVFAGLAVPAASLMKEGPFAWHATQPSFYQGLAEIGLLGLLLYFIQAIPRRWVRILLGALVSGFYARRHGVDVQILIGLLYVEGVFALGQHVYNRMAATTCSTAKADTVVIFGAGLTGWLLLTWLHSFSGLADAIPLSAMAVAILGVAILLNRSPFTLRMLRTLTPAVSHPERALRAALVAAGLGLFAKAGVAIDYDSAWYGLHGAKVLAPGGSLFAETGLVAPVHYYPKLYESLLLPLSALGSSSLIYSPGIYSVALLTLLSMKIWSDLLGEASLPRWAPLLVASVPAVLIISLTAKGDAFSALLYLSAIYCVITFNRAKQVGWLSFALVFMAYAGLTRLASLPYVAILGIYCAALAVGWRGHFSHATEFNRFAALTLTAAAAVVGLVVYRTIKLAGAPFVAPKILVTLAQAVGFHLEYPVGLLPDTTAVAALSPLAALKGYLLFPADYSSLLTTWPGNAWACFAITALVLGAKPRPSRGLLLLLVVGISGYLTLFTYRFLPGRGADGNYFIIPYLCLTIASAYWAAEVHGAARKRAVEFVAIALAFFGFAVALLTGSWAPGTRAWDGQMTRRADDLNRAGDDVIESAGLSGVRSYLAGRSTGDHAVGVDAGGVQTVPPGAFLPVRYESVEIFGWANPALTRDPAAFAEFLRRAGVDYVVLPATENVKEGSEWAEQIARSAVEAAQGEGWAELSYSDEKYRVWAVHYTEPTRTELEGGLGWIESRAVATTNCSPQRPFAAVVRWQLTESSSAAPIRIFVQAPSQQEPALWAEVGHAGTQQTGEWLEDGSRIILKSAKGSRIGVLQVPHPCD